MRNVDHIYLGNITNPITNDFYGIIHERFLLNVCQRLLLI